MKVKKRTETSYEIDQNLSKKTPTQKFQRNHFLEQQISVERDARHENRITGAGSISSSKTFLQVFRMKWPLLDHRPTTLRT